MKNKGITLVALVITIILLLILAGISIATLTGSGVFEKAKQAKEESEKKEIEETLILAINELQLEKRGKAKINDISQEWLENKLTKYKNIVVEEETIKGKYIFIQKDDTVKKFFIDEKLKLKYIEDIEEIKLSTIKFSYDILEKNDNLLDLLINIQDEERGISKVEFPNGDVLTFDGTIEKIEKDYKVEIGKEYIIKITLNNGEQEKKLINIQNVELKKVYLIKDGKDNTEITGGWEGIPYYGRETGTLTFEDGYANFVGTDYTTIYRKATINSIDWSLYNSINIKAKPYNALSEFSSYGMIGVDITDDKTGFDMSYLEKLIGYSYKYPPTIDQEISLSLNLSSDYVENTYISIVTHRCYLKIYDVWLEKYVEN